MTESFCTSRFPGKEPQSRDQIPYHAQWDARAIDAAGYSMGVAISGDNKFPRSSTDQTSMLAAGRMAVLGFAAQEHLGIDKLREEVLDDNKRFGLEQRLSQQATDLAIKNHLAPEGSSLDVHITSFSIPMETLRAIQRRDGSPEGCH